MRVNPPDSAPPQRGPFDQRQHLIMFGEPRSVERAQVSEDVRSGGDDAEGEFAQHEGVDDDAVLLEQPRQPRIAVPPEVHPNGRVGEDDHRRRRADRRRGAASRSGMVPANAAKRRAASRAISACRPACTRAVFSAMPVSRRACSTSRSSKMSVVRICIYMYE